MNRLNSHPLMKEPFIRKPKGERTDRSLPGWLKIIIGMVLVFSGMMLYVWKNIEVSQLAKQISSLKKEKEYLSNENKSLALEIASLSHLARIEQIAKEELGLEYPATYPIVFKMTPVDRTPQGFLAYIGLNRLWAFVREMKAMVLPTAEAELLHKEREQ